MFCDKLCKWKKERKKKVENERRCKKGIMQFAKHVKQELVETSKKGSFREEFRDTKAREIGREKRPEYVLQ
jgi:hypothetical protein